jgi:hypothetical protein
LWHTNALKNGQGRLARRYAAVQQKAKLLNGRAIRSHGATRHAIALVKGDLD